jgi:hypothetical protein
MDHVPIRIEMEIGTDSTLEILLTLAEILQTGNFECVEAFFLYKLGLLQLNYAAFSFQVTFVSASFLLDQSSLYLCLIDSDHAVTYSSNALYNFCRQLPVLEFRS